MSGTVTPAVRTHAAIDPALSGRVVELEPGRAVLALETSPGMAADDRGLVHGGFVFSLADHAAMQAVGEPTVVLGAAEVRFARPVRVGESLRAEACCLTAEGKKLPVEVTVTRGSETVMHGRFICFVPPHHVLEPAAPAR